MTKDEYERIAITILTGGPMIVSPKIYAQLRTYVQMHFPFGTDKQMDVSCWSL